MVGPRVEALYAPEPMAVRCFACHHWLSMPACRPPLPTLHAIDSPTDCPHVLCALRACACVWGRLKWWQATNTTPLPGGVDYRYLYAAQAAVGDFVLHCPTRRAARMLSSSQNATTTRKVFAYTFDHAPWMR